MDLHSPTLRSPYWFAEKFLRHGDAEHMELQEALSPLLRESLGVQLPRRSKSSLLRDQKGRTSQQWQAKVTTLFSDLIEAASRELPPAALKGLGHVLLGNDPAWSRVIRSLDFAAGCAKCPQPLPRASRLVRALEASTLR